MKGDNGMITNKIYALLMISFGFVPVALDSDATLLVLISLIAIPMFFSKKKWII